MISINQRSRSIETHSSASDKVELILHQTAFRKEDETATEVSLISLPLPSRHTPDGEINALGQFNPSISPFNTIALGLLNLPLLDRRKVGRTPSVEPFPTARKRRERRTTRASVPKKKVDWGERGKGRDILMREEEERKMTVGEERRGVSTRAHGKERGGREGSDLVGVRLRPVRLILPRRIRGRFGVEKSRS